MLNESDNYVANSGVQEQDAIKTARESDSKETASNVVNESTQPKVSEDDVTDAPGEQQGKSLRQGKKAPKERKVTKITLPPIIDDFVEENKELPFGAKYNPAQFAKKHNISAAVVVKDVYHAALIKGCKPLEFVNEGTTEDTVFVNDIGLIVIGKTKHGFPNNTRFTVLQDDGGIHLTALA